MASSKTHTSDVTIIGAGIVGLSTAWQLKQRQPDWQVTVIDKEPRIGAHQTSHNSGVIHSGIYYEPGSLKARFCRAGLDATIEFCQSRNIPFEQCGKLIVATNPLEQERLAALAERGAKNELDVELIDEQQLRDLEPAIRGSGAILVPQTGIVDYRQVAAAMAEAFESAGGQLQLGAGVTAIEESGDGTTVSLDDGTTVRSGFLLACAGLMADRLAMLHKISIDFRIIPYRGEYFVLPPAHNSIVKHLIYPVPDPALPFLGVHLTRMIDGTVTVGPNAVQAFKREGYGRVNVSARDIASMLGFAGFWRVVKANFGTGIRELRNSLWKRGYLEEVRKYCPSLTVADLLPHPAGIRAQAVLKDGTIVHDFLFAETERSLHVCNAPSPAATSAIPIGNYLCERLETKVSND